MNQTNKPHTLLTHLRISVIATLTLAVIVSGIYPLIVTGLAQLFFHDKANGSLLRDKSGQVVGSRLIGQNFNDGKYFHPRPSQNSYDPTNTGGSNFGPLSQKFIDTVKTRITQYTTENHAAFEARVDKTIPADAVTASASGLDPHISVENARLQARRVADARHLPIESVNQLIDQNTDGRDLGILGEPGVNVVLLNLALDQK